MLCFKVTFVKSLSVHIILHNCRSAMVTETVTWDNDRKQLCLNPRPLHLPHALDTAWVSASFHIFSKLLCDTQGRLQT